MSLYFTYPITRLSMRFSGTSCATGTFFFLFALAIESPFFAIFEIVYFGVFMSLSILLGTITAIMGVVHFKDFGQFAIVILLQILNGLLAFIYLNISFTF